MSADFWDVLLLLAIVLLIVIFPRISLCCGCVANDEGHSSGGDPDCRKECLAYRAYVRKCGGPRDER
jgi:hypothetical protein